MANPDTPGKDTSEWTVFKWVALICAALASGLGIVAASGAIADPTVLAILSGAAAVLAAIGGAGGKAYIDGRSAVKVAKVVAAEGAAADPTDG